MGLADTPHVKVETLWASWEALAQHPKGIDPNVGFYPFTSGLRSLKQKTRSVKLATGILF